MRQLGDSEGFQMPSIGRWQETRWDSGLLERRWKWCYFKMRRKKTWSSKRYEMIKWGFGDATLVTEILCIAADLLMALLSWWLYWNSWWCTNNTELVYLLSQTYFNWGTKWLFDSRNKYIWKVSSMGMLFVILLVQGYQDIEWIF